eukprot:m.224091 g.224091  ORF g.224091 m.224091 type:complete len:238 (+) comp15641_c0_seq1:3061-3774(+)
MAGKCAAGCFCGPGFSDWKRVAGQTRKTGRRKVQRATTRPSNEKSLSSGAVPVKGGAMAASTSGDHIRLGRASPLGGETLAAQVAACVAPAAAPHRATVDNALCILCMCDNGTWFQGRIFVRPDDSTEKVLQRQLLLFGELQPDVTPEDAGMDPCCFEPSSAFYRVTISDGVSRRVLDQVLKTGEDNASFESEAFSFRCAAIKVDGDAVDLATKCFPSIPSSVSAHAVVCTGAATVP